MRRAVIDVGSNSVLLVVAERRGGEWIPDLETSTVTGLGEGVKTTGKLSEESITRTLAALSAAFQKARSQGAKQVTAAATMAARMASNTGEFVHRAEQQGTPVTILSAEDEAELGFRSVAEDPTFAGSSPLTIVDVGGQSTEIVNAEHSDSGWTIRFQQSFPVGTLGLRSGALVDEAPSQACQMRAVAEIDKVLCISFRPSEAGQVAALGATATNLVALREKMVIWQPELVHGTKLEYEEISRAAGWLCSMSDAERAALPGLEAGRERTIHIGTLMLERCLFALRVEGCSVSVRGWRHSMLADDTWFSD